jgi:hypothetical protein
VLFWHVKQFKEPVEDKGSVLLWHVKSHWPSNTAWQPGRLECSAVLLL